jgi:tRNA G18 (ribose-2'-O)-methylase SpoU
VEQVKQQATPSVEPPQQQASVQRFSCEVCRIHCRSASNLRDHLNGKTHRRNAALLCGTALDPMDRAAAAESSRRDGAPQSVHCLPCDAWVPEAEFARHLQSPSHAVAIRAQAAGTCSRAFFGATETAGDSSVGVITCDLEQEANAGTICRSLANFCGVGARLLHVQSPPTADGASRNVGGGVLVSGRLRSVSRHCEQKLTRQLLSLDDFIEMLPRWERPIVAVETASGAQDLTSFAFPAVCDVLVGGESTGVAPRILAALRPDVDRIVYVPMAGFHKSMNVAQAVTVALYEYRRQHPG